MKHPDYQFTGYRLDEKRFPTFLYRYRALTITDAFAPEEIDGVTSIVRTLTTSGDADDNIYFRIAETGPQTKSDDWIDAGGVKVRVSGAEPVTRKVGTGNETLVPISGETTLTITYRWPSPLKP